MMRTPNAGSNAARTLLFREQNICHDDGRRSHETKKRERGSPIFRSEFLRHGQTRFESGKEPGKRRQRNQASRIRGEKPRQRAPMIVCEFAW